MLWICQNKDARKGYPPRSLLNYACSQAGFVQDFSLIHTCTLPLEKHVQTCKSKTTTTTTTKNNNNNNKTNKKQKTTTKKAQASNIFPQNSLTGGKSHHQVICLEYCRSEQLMILHILQVFIMSFACSHDLVSKRRTSRIFLCVVQR